MHRLNQTEALLILEQGRGAYQSPYVLFRAPEQAKRLVLTLPDAFDKEYQKTLEIDSFIEADYDTKTGELSFHARGRAPADCGESASWQFDGKNFQLEYWYYMGRCGGAPGNWLPLWVSKQTF